MGFLSKIFGNKKQGEIKSNLETLPKLLEKNFNVKNNELEVFSAKKISELKFLYQKSNALLKKIKESDLEKKENERFNKAANTAKKQMQKQIEKILERIDPSKTSSELRSVYAYSKESFVFLFNEINSYRKSIAYTSVYLKDEMKELGSTLGEILKEFEEINKEFEKENDIFEFENLKEEIKNVQNINQEINKLNDNKNNYEEDLKKIKENKKETENNLEKVKDSDNSKLLKKFEEEKSELLNKKQSLKIELTSMISTVDKPLNKYLILAKGGREKITKEEIDLLELFLTNPIYALKKDLKGESIKSILTKVLGAIEDEKIDLKEKEKEKRIDALRELISFDFFGNIFWKINQIQKEINEIEENLKSNSTVKDIKDLDEKISNLEKEIKEKNNEIEIAKKEVTNKNEILDEKLNKITKFSEKILNKKVILTN